MINTSKAYNIQHLVSRKTIENIFTNPGLEHIDVVFNIHQQWVDHPKSHGCQG